MTLCLPTALLRLSENDAILKGQRAIDCQRRVGLVVIALVHFDLRRMNASEAPSPTRTIFHIRLLCSICLVASKFIQVIGLRRLDLIKLTWVCPVELTWLF